MKTNIVSMSFATFAVLALSGNASGQSTTVDAVATPVSTTPPLVLTGARSFSFGEVNIPNGTEDGHSCKYQHNTTGYLLAELDENGSHVTGATPNASGCDWGNTGSFTGHTALVSVQCNPASVVGFTGAWGAGGVTGISFRRPDIYGLRAYSSGTDTVINNGSSTGTLSTVCPNSGAFDVAIGAQMTMTDEVVAGSDVTVGTITLNATY